MNLFSKVHLQRIYGFLQ